VFTIIGPDPKSDELEEICGELPPAPPAKIYNMTNLYLRFVTNDDLQYTGFRLQFSFHKESALPEQLSDGRWNCSVPHWPDFRQHLPCNLLNDCLEGQDELDCPYTSPLCGPGRFFMGGSCYSYVKMTRPLTWHVASDACEILGAHLVSLNDATEWRAVTSMLRQYGVKAAYTGLHLGFRQIM